MKFYATVSFGFPMRYLPDDVTILLPASSWARGQRRDGSLPSVRVSDNVKEIAADCGGFVASRIWGEYRYSPAQYVNWLHRIGDKLTWAATMDYCCEPPVLGSGTVAERQAKTTLNAWLFWDEYKHVPWAWVPTLQGWDVADYLAHIEDMRSLIYQMKAHYDSIGNPHFRVGIGTLCARASNAMINQVLTACRNALPEIEFHLWGVKLGYLQSGYHPTQVISVDSAAWDKFGLHSDGIKAREGKAKSGLTQRQYAGRHLLPAYIDQIHHAHSGVKQIGLL